MEDMTMSRIGSEDLDRSLKLLDSVLNSSQKSLFRVQKRKASRSPSYSNARSNNRKSRVNRLDHVINDLDLIPGQLSYSSKDDFNSEDRESLASERFESKFFKSKFNGSELSLRSMDSRRVLKNSTVFSSLSLGQDAGKSAQDRLYTEFLEAWQSGSSDHDAFNTIMEFINICNDTLDVMMSTEAKRSRSNKIKEEKQWLETMNERNTWKLIFALYQDRLNNEQGDVDMDQDFEYEMPSEKEIMLQLYKSDRDVRESQLVIDWLEQNAGDILDDIILEQYTDKTIAWENTLHQLQSKESIPYRSSREIVTRLDPDAPRRQARPLHDLDKEDEDRVTLQMFNKIRSGRLEDAQALCVHAGQSWRAAILEGWHLYHDPNYKVPVGKAETRKPLPVEGNPYRDVWKVCAWKMCNDSRIPLRTRAAIAAYCGHLSVLLSVSTSWEDYLWSYLKTHVDVRVEQEIRENSFKTYVELPQDYWNNKLNFEDIFGEIAASKDNRIQKEAVKFERVIQRYIILDKITLLMQDVSKWIQGADFSVGNDSDSISPHSLRFLTHVVLFLRRIGKSECESIGDAVIEAYVKFLIEMKDSNLIAWYVSQLPQEDQIYYYAAFLEEITDSEERSICLQAAQDAGLNIDAITKTVVENIRQQPASGIEIGYGLPMHPDVSPEDIVKISALDWLLFYPKQRTELLLQANALISSFLSTSNLQAAKLTMSKIPHDSIDLITSQYVSGQNVDDTFINIVLDNLPRHVRSAKREYLCYKTYLEAEESFADWFQHFHHGKPQAPVIKPGANFTEKVSFEHKFSEYKIELERWKIAMENQTKTTKTLLQNVLTFPDGWLVDAEDLEDTERNVHLNGLRSIVVPKIALLLHTVLHSMEDYASCVALADLIACRQRQLFKAFSKSKMQDLLEKICESSVALMNEQKDSWGFPSA